MKILISSLFLLLSSQSAYANNDIPHDCFNMSEKALICLYQGNTGLELLPDAKLHQVQRQAVYYGDAPGSVVLVKNAQIRGYTYNECWSTSHKLDRDLLLFCKFEDSLPKEIPPIILNEIDHMRTK